MIQIIKFNFLEDLEVIDDKIRNLMRLQSNEDDTSIPNLIEKTLENTLEIEIGNNDSLIVSNKGDCSYFISLLERANVKYYVEDLTTLYFNNKLNQLVSKSDLDNFDKTLLEVLSIDDVLDKISQTGIESLNEVDKKVLGNQF